MPKWFDRWLRKTTRSDVRRERTEDRRRRGDDAAVGGVFAATVIGVDGSTDRQDQDVPSPDPNLDPGVTGGDGFDIGGGFDGGASCGGAV